MVVTVRLFPLHAFGARYDLPAPLYLFLIGAGAVVFVSFLLVLRRPVTRQEPAGDDVPPVPQAPSWPGWLMVVAAVVLILGGLVGTQSTPDNSIVTAFWLVFWIAVPISVAILGNYWPYISPLNVVARLVGHTALFTPEGEAICLEFVLPKQVGQCKELAVLVGALAEKTASIRLE